ncbi:MAG: DUF1572 family protein [Saprospiraceae bacterium]|nr:DUF1572 family protein [Saprospiraceae bacterium]
MEKLEDILVAQLVNETKRRIIEEGINRIRKCLGALDMHEIWFRPNENSNSVGNLVLHLCGNVRQWAITTFSGITDSRHRQQEFDERGPLPVSELLQLLDQLESDLNPVLDNLDAKAIAGSYQVQGFNETGTAILVHISEHFSYHVGQITYFVKMKKDMDIGYYADQDLDSTT